MENTANRQLHMTRTIDASIELMWEVWTNPEHIVKWWGPDGFTNTIHVMDFREGGEWNLTMHGPDGTNYPNKSIFREIVPFKKIVFEHFNPHFFATIVFEPKGAMTEIDWTLVFDTADMREILIRTYKADEGHRQNVERLSQYLSTMAADAS